MSNQPEPADCWFCGRWTRTRQCWRTGQEIPAWRVECGGCEAQGPRKQSSAEAIHAWNGALNFPTAKPEVRISDGCLVCLECGCAFEAIDDDPTCAGCRGRVEVAG